ncbi:MAG: aldehyde dehydrogenase (NADP(+)) [Pseudomonadota bacterium]
MSKIDGSLLIGAASMKGTAGTVHAIDPATRATMEPAFTMAGEEQVAQACALAQQAFDSYRATSLEERAVFLETIAQGILDLGPVLIERAMRETGLPQARLEGERGRTIGQLRLFAKVVRDGHWLGATLDSALPERVPPRPDLRMCRIGLGPVAVFGASNFPLAFSVAGGDTASALAAGCPVVVKAHHAHLGTGELVGRVIQRAVAECGLPEGVFSLLAGEGRVAGQQLAAHPAIKAVGFTGSRAGGMALVRTAAQRHEPIPVYAEMSSINPVFLMAGALAGDSAALAQGFVDSLTLGAGQFCTNPGLVLAIDGAPLDRFVAAAASALQAKPGATMLTPGIHDAYVGGTAHLAGIAGVQEVALGQPGATQCAARPALYTCSGSTWLSTPALEGEIFGPCSLVVRCADEAELLRIAAGLEGQLTATVHATADDQALARALLPTLERKAGRVLFNGFPTGVEVAHAMVHGGPFPSTSDSRSTSVGATAIDRFLRPVCYQNLPAYLLPAALQDTNPLGLARMQDGTLTRAQ